jgi:branched-subunit amino acid ABC-type transport system permease component
VGGAAVLELVVISTLNGVLYGMLLFLMASGLTVIFSMLGVLNFAHASFYMLGAFFGFQISRWIGFWPALLIAPPLVGAIGAAVRRDAPRSQGELHLLVLGLAGISRGDPHPERLELADHGEDDR